MAAREATTSAAAASDGGVSVATGDGGGGPTLDEQRTLYDDVGTVLETYRDSDDITQRTVIHQVAQAITAHRNYLYPRRAIGDWTSTLHRYDKQTGVYRPDGEEELESLCEQLLGDFLTNNQANELKGRFAG